MLLILFKHANISKRKKSGHKRQFFSLGLKLFSQAFSINGCKYTSSADADLLNGGGAPAGGNAEQ